MQALECIIGVLMIIGAVIAVIIAFTDETVIALGAAILLGAVGGFSLYHGWHGESAKFYAKHQAIMRDVQAQGFDAPYNQVYAVGGHYFIGTEVDLRLDKCLYPFIARKIEGVWHLTLPSRSQNGVHVFTLADTKQLAAAC